MNRFVSFNFEGLGSLVLIWRENLLPSKTIRINHFADLIYLLATLKHLEIVLVHQLLNLRSIRAIAIINKSTCPSKFFHLLVLCHFRLPFRAAKVWCSEAAHALHFLVQVANKFHFVWLRLTLRPFSLPIQVRATNLWLHIGFRLLHLAVLVIYILLVHQVLQAIELIVVAVEWGVVRVLQGCQALEVGWSNL